MLSTIVSSVLVIFVTFCAVKAVRALKLLNSALWLAGVSAGVTLMLFLIGAPQIAVIELSLSLGLVTVLLVFAISMVGANSPDLPVRGRTAWLLVLPMLLLLAALILPALPVPPEAEEDAFSTVLWEGRQVDVLAQIALIFAGVMGMLRLLGLPDAHRHNAMEDEAEHEMSKEIAL
jgi:NADH:ubiquinone oxidoreductase subunit 6 (subunit J)